VSLAPFGRRRLRVTGRRAIGAYDVLSVADPDGPAPDAGQFAMLAAADGWGGLEDERPFLPRAFSVARRHPDGTLDFVLEDVGPGTERLCALAPGEDVWLVGPLGRGFAPPGEGRRPVLVGGGVGIAPLMIWSDVLGGPTALLGFRDAAHAEGATLLPGARVATDDGSAGHHGLVTELLAEEIGFALRSSQARTSGRCHTSDSAPATTSMISCVMSAWRSRLSCSVRSSMISDAFSEALRMAVMRAPCSDAVDSSSAR